VHDNASVTFNVLQIACVLKCLLDMIKKLVEDDSELPMMENGDGRIALYIAVKQRASLDVMRYLVRRTEALLSKGAQLLSVSGANICISLVYAAH